MMRFSNFYSIAKLSFNVVLLTLTGCGDSFSHAKLQEQTYKESYDTTFDVASITPDSTLSDMRGGFVTQDGLFINFNLSSLTKIDGETVSSILLSTNGLNGVRPGTLQQLLQTGTNNNSAIAPSALPSNVLSVVQNSANGRTIQTQNILDITVGNLAAFRNQQIAFGTRFATGLAR